MASFIVFNGVTRFLPGGVSRVNADNLNPVTLGTNGVVALIGEAEGGEPGVLFSFSDMAKVRSVLGAGDLVDAANIAFSPSNDPLVPGGASQVLLYKTNASTQATGSLPGAYPTALRTAAATGGGVTTLVDSALTVSSFDSQFVGSYLVARPNTATQEIKEVTAYSASTGTFTVASAWTVNPSASDPYSVLASNLELAANVSVGSTSTTLNLTGVTTLTANALAGYTVYVKGLTAATSVYRTVVSNTTSALTISPALNFVPVAGTVALIMPKAVALTSKIYGIEANDVQVDIGPFGTGRQVTVTKGSITEPSGQVGGFPFLKVLFRGATIGVADTIAAGSTASVLNMTTAGLTLNAHVGAQVRVGSSYTTVVSNTTSALTVSPPLAAVPAVGTSVQLFAVSPAVGYFVGANGYSTQFVTRTGTPANDLSITIPVNLTLTQLAGLINANSNYLATIPNNVNGDVIYASDFDFGQETMRSIKNSASLETYGFRQDVMQVVYYLNSVSSYVGASRDTTTAKSGSALTLDTPSAVALVGALRGASTNSTFQAGFDALVNVRANSVVPLIDRDMTLDGLGSTATLQSVAAQMRDHLVLCRGVGGSERGGFIGVNGTKDEIIAQAAALNDMDAAVVAQSPTALGTRGTLQSFGPRVLAALAAGMRAGVFEVAEPLTKKILKVSSLTNHASWNPTDLTDVNDLIQAGVLFAITDNTGVTRWARDLTTWIADSNLAYSEGSVRDAVRYTIYGLRKALQDRYTGRKGALANIRGAKTTAITFLEQVRGQNIIVDSVDLATGAPVKAYSNLKFTVSGDVMTLSVCIVPVVGVNFIINDITLKLASQSL